MARAIVAKSTALGGTMTLEDLANYQGEWVQPAMTHYHGYAVYELPPPSQDWAACEMLNILEACVPHWSTGADAGDRWDPPSPAYWHVLVEAKKLAYADLYRFNGDPDFITVPLGRLLSKDYAASLCSRVDPHKATNIGGSAAPASGDGDTIVLADRRPLGQHGVLGQQQLRGVRLRHHGAGLWLHPAQSRRAVLARPEQPQCDRPAQAALQHLSAGFVMQRWRRRYMTLTLMGGDMQAQGHAQMMVNMVDLGANVQAATDMARFHHLQISNALLLESPLYERVGARAQRHGP